MPDPIKIGFVDGHSGSRKGNQINPPFDPGSGDKQELVKANAMNLS
jgi:hypothetical protein